MTSCPDCRARSQAIPYDALRVMLTHNWHPEDLAFEARAMTQQQAVAAELLSHAIGAYWRAFGVDLLGARLNSTLMVLRDQAKRQRAVARILKAREEINARARECYERGDHETAHMIEGESTPDYPGKARDERYLWGTPPAKAKAAPPEESAPEVKPTRESRRKPANLVEPDSTAAVLLMSLVADPARVDSHVETLAALPCGRFTSLRDQVVSLAGEQPHQLEPIAQQLGAYLESAGLKAARYNPAGWERAARALATRHAAK